MSTVSDADLSAVSHFLEPGETVRWIGQPNPRRRMAASLPVSVFGMVFGGFALFWMAAATGFTFGLGGGAGLFALFGVPFFLAGLAMVLSPVWAYRSALRTLYVVTDRRALIATPGSGGLTVQTFRPEELDELGVTVRPNGSGTIRFAPPGLLRLAARDSETTTKALPAFTDVADVLHVKGLLGALHHHHRRALTAPLEDDAGADAGDEASDARTAEPPAWNLTPPSGA